MKLILEIFTTLRKPGDILSSGLACRHSKILFEERINCGHKSRQKLKSEDFIK